LGLERELSLKELRLAVGLEEELEEDPRLGKGDDEEDELSPAESGAARQTFVGFDLELDTLDDWR